MILCLKLHRNFNETWRAKLTLDIATDELVAAYKEGIEKSEFYKKAVKKPARRPRKKISASKSEEKVSV